MPKLTLQAGEAYLKVNHVSIQPQLFVGGVVASSDRLKYALFLLKNIADGSPAAVEAAKEWVDKEPAVFTPLQERATIIELTLGDRTFHGQAFCSPLDHFKRQYGRKVAAERLLADLRSAGISKEDRITVFRKICPEYVPPLRGSNGTLVDGAATRG